MCPFWLATKWAEEISNLPKGPEPASFREKGWTVALYPGARKQVGWTGLCGMWAEHAQPIPAASLVHISQGKGSPPHHSPPEPLWWTDWGLWSGLNTVPTTLKGCSCSLAGKSHPTHRAQVCELRQRGVVYIHPHCFLWESTSSGVSVLAGSAPLLLSPFGDVSRKILKVKDGCPASHFKLPLAIYFTYGNVYVSVLIS